MDLFWVVDLSLQIIVVYGPDIHFASSWQQRRIMVNTGSMNTLNRSQMRNLFNWSFVCRENNFYFDVNIACNTMKNDQN